MAPSRSAGPSLSAGLLKHLGVHAHDSPGRGRRNTTRERQWKGAGADSLQTRGPNQIPHTSQRPGPSQRQQTINIDKAPPSKAKNKPGQVRLVNPELDDDSVDESDFDDFDVSENEDILDNGVFGEESDSGDGSSDSGTAAPTKVSRRMREKLEQDDAEIAELERKLGLKGRKNLPQTFKEDGLGDLLESLGEAGGKNTEAVLQKKRKNEAEEWLYAKRQKAMGLKNGDTHDSSGNEDDNDESEDDDNNEDDDVFSISDEGSGDSKIFEPEREEDSKTQPPKRVRENPYVAPVATSSSSQKYVPPALRKAQQATDSESEAVTRVRRQAHHLIARLSDANMLTILGDVEKLYLDNPRQFVTDAVTDKLLEQIHTEGALSNNVTVLIAGFAAAVFMVKGPDFGANFIQQNATLFKQHYDALVTTDTSNAPDSRQHSRTPSSKMALNLFALMAELYNFRMIGPNLMYDYIRMLLGNLTETNAELLLRVFEISGHRLHQDDPRALKDIVALIQPAVMRAGGERNLSVRTRHMIDRISDIKKSDKKKQRDAESSGFGHAERIRKVLGTLPTSRKLEAAGPLRVSLADIEHADKRGKWWLVGASWAGRDERPGGQDTGSTEAPSANDEPAARQDTRQPAPTKPGEDDVLGSWGDGIADLEELDLLAREQGMNTDARRSIFVTLLSAADSKDAHARLLRLGLNKFEKREVANVLIRCVGSEQHYNRYYALVARQVCSADRRMSWVFQASVWKLFRRMGEPMFGEVPEDDEADEEDEATGMRRIVNTAKLCGYLIACGCLALDILKCLSLVRLQAKTRVFVEVMLLSFFEEAHTASKASKARANSSNSSALIRKRFQSASDKDDLRRGLQYFIDKVVRRSKLVEKHQASRITKACDRAQKALRDPQTS